MTNHAVPTAMDLRRLRAATACMRRKALLGYSADDLAQDAAAHWCRYGEQARSFVGWTIHYARQINEWNSRREKVRVLELDRESHLVEVSTECDPAAMLIAKETAQRAMRAIAELPLRDVQVLAHRMQGRDDNEAALACRISQDAVRQVICRARRKIAEAIA